MTARIAVLMFVMALAGLLARPGAAQGEPAEHVLARGNPPLTRLMADQAISLLGWALASALTPAEEDSVLQTILQAWREQDRDAMDGVLSLVNLYEELARQSEAEREAARASLAETLLGSLRAEPEEGLARALLAAYERSHGARPGEIGGLEGIYRLVRPKRAGVGTVVEYLTFLPDGYVYWTLPAGGLLHFEPEVAQRVRPNDWGTYTADPDVVRVLRGPERTPYTLTRSGERLVNPAALGGGSFRPVLPGDGLQLDGAYRRGSNPPVTFRPDGTFRDEGAFLYSSYRKLDGSEYRDDGVGGEGTYLVARNTLELRYTDGRVKRFAFIVFPETLEGQPAVRSFLLNWDEQWERSD